MKTSHGELRQSVFDANQELVRAGLVVLTFGNASGADRRSGVMAIKPSGIPYDRLRPDDMVVIDLESGHVVDGENNPSSDTPTHLVLYREFGEIGGVVHTHSPFATAWAQAQRDLPCLGTTHADHFFGSIPVTRPLTSDEVAHDYEEHTGDVIVERFEDLELDPAAMPAALVASHGPFVWGEDLESAVENAIALEAIATTALSTIVLNQAVKSIPNELLGRHFRRKHGPTAYYGQS